MYMGALNKSFLESILGPIGDITYQTDTVTIQTQDGKLIIDQRTAQELEKQGQQAHAEQTGSIATPAGNIPTWLVWGGAAVAGIGLLSAM